MVAVGPVQLPEMERHPGAAGEGQPELLAQLSVEGADLLGGQVQMIAEHAAAGDIHRRENQRLVHGQGRGAVAADAPAVAQGLLEGRAQADAHVLHGVVIVHVPISVTDDL